MKIVTKKVNLSQKTISESEKWSLMMDGMLSDAEVDALLNRFNDDAAREWQAYHLIGDVLRSSDMAHSHVVLAQSHYYEQIKEQLAQEPLIMAPVNLPRSDSHKKRLSIRWPQFAGFVAASGFVAFAVISVVNMNTDELLGERTGPRESSLVQAIGVSARLPQPQGSQIVANASRIAGADKHLADVGRAQPVPSAVAQSTEPSTMPLRFVNTTASRPQKPGQALVPYLTAHRQFGYGATLNSSMPMDPYIVQTTADIR